MRSTIPSIRLMRSIDAPSSNTSLARMRNKMLDKMTIGKSKNLVLRVSTIGDIIAVTPSMRNILAILDPSTFPIAISVLPDILARIETISSGILVPTATIVSPMIASEIWRRLARETAPSTRTLPQNVRSMSQRMIDAMAMRMVMCMNSEKRKIDG